MSTQSHAVRSTPRHAFTAITLNGGFMLARANEASRGCDLIPSYGYFTTRETALGVARELNLAMGLTENEAAQIIARKVR
jgi:hypothetical protein